MGGEYHSIYSGAVLNFVENPETVPENVREIAPTVFTAVPRVWEKFYSGVLIGLKQAGAVQQLAYKLAIGIGLRRARLREEGKPVPVWLDAAFGLARLLVLNNVRKLIGVHRAKVLITGAAPISPELIRWYMALGLEMFEVWGQTESCGAVTSNIAGKVKPGSIGPRMSHAEVKVSAEGELLVRGKTVFMGYLNQPEKTAETLKDGWLHTGDVGKVDADGYFYITDRMKDIIITAGGKNITPSEFENHLKFSPFITDAVVIGDKRPYLVALVMIDHENVERYAQDHADPVLQFRQPVPAAGGAGADPGRDRPRQPGLRARRAGEEVPPDRAEAHRRGRGTDADHETEEEARQREVQGPDRIHVHERGRLRACGSTSPHTRAPSSAMAIPSSRTSSTRRAWPRCAACSASTWAPTPAAIDFEGTAPSASTRWSRAAGCSGTSRWTRASSRCASASCCPGCLLTASQAIWIRPGETPQPLHHDDTFYTVPRPRPMISLSTIVAVDAFTAENGGTEVIPGSHLWDDAGRLPGGTERGCRQARGRHR